MSAEFDRDCSVFLLIVGRENIAGWREMNTLQRYVLYQLVAATVIATVAITVAVSLTQSVHLIKLALVHGAGLEVLLRLAALLLPSFLILVLPLSVSLAVMFVYRKMIDDHEIVAMRSAGLSHVALAAPGLVLAAAVTVIAYSISLYFMPVSMREAQDTKFAIRTAPYLLLKEGVFNNVKSGLTVYFRERWDDGTMTGLLVSDNRNRAKTTIFMAKYAFLKLDEQRARIVLSEGNRQERDNERGDVVYLEFDRATLELDLGTNIKWSRSYSPAEKFVWELLDPANAPDDPLRRNRDTAAGHSRLAAPLYVIGFALIALAGAIAPNGSRRGNNWFILAAAMAIVIVQAGAFGAIALVEAFPAATPLIYANVVLPALAVYLFLRRLDRRVWVPSRL